MISTGMELEMQMEMARTGDTVSEERIVQESVLVYRCPIDLDCVMIDD